MHQLLVPVLLYVTLNCQSHPSRLTQALGLQRSSTSLGRHAYDLYELLQYLDSSAHMLCLGSAPVCSTVLPPPPQPWGAGVKDLKSEDEALVWGSNPKLPTLNSLPPLLQWPPVVLGRISQVNNPFKRENVCVCVYPNY